MDAKGPYALHLFHCLNDTSCTVDGPGAEIHALFKRRIKQAGLQGRVRANRAGCFSQCGHGPMLVVYPEGVWYCHLDVADADRVWKEHVVGGRPVEALRYHPARPGANKLPRRRSRDLDVVDDRHPDYAPCRRCPRPYGDGKASTIFLK